VRVGMRDGRTQQTILKRTELTGGARRSKLPQQRPRSEALDQPVFPLA
jgi:hypothetical protein